MHDNDLITKHSIDGDIDISLRPKLLQEFVGQSSIKENLGIYLQAAKNRNEPLDHVILYGPPGLGKTTIAQIIAKEMSANIKITSGPILAKAGDLAAILTSLEMGDVLFIDEIHRIHPAVEEVLYSAMEDYAIDIMIGEGPSARSLRIDLPRFTLVGATTRIGLLTNPLRDRFGIQLRIEFYNSAELALIVKRTAQLLKAETEEDATKEIGQRARGTPRIAIRLFKRVRDYADVYNNHIVNLDIATRALKMIDIDSYGLDSNDFRYLKIIIENFSGGPVGIDTIAAAMSEQRDTIEEVIEPFLIQIGFINRTSKGRIIMLKAYEHLGYSIPQNMQTQIDNIF